jgi:hypothetical protein
MTYRPNDVGSALSLQLSANNLRAVADAARKRGDLTVAGCREIEADEMEGAAAAFLVPDKPLGPPGIGGELVPEMLTDTPSVFDTLKTSPDMLNATASRERLDLAAAAGALVLGTDIAETIGARNSLERMLAHQLGAVHLMAMKFSDQATRHLASYELQSNRGRYFAQSCGQDSILQDQTQKYQALLVEASRAGNTATRLMGAFQDGLLALDRIRRGGKQTVKVVHVHQHVAVAAGAQAVVAGGNVKGGRRKSGEFPRSTRVGEGPKRRKNGRGDVSK